MLQHATNGPKLFGLVDMKTEWASAELLALNLPAIPPPEGTETSLSSHTTWPITEQWASAMEDGEGGEIGTKSLGRERADKMVTFRGKYM